MAKIIGYYVIAEVIDINRDLFTVKLQNEHICKCRIAGKLRQHQIKIVLGDKVEVELCPYDLSRGRITYRYK